MIVHMVIIKFTICNDDDDDDDDAMTAMMRFDCLSEAILTEMTWILFTS